MHAHDLRSHTIDCVMEAASADHSLLEVVIDRGPVARLPVLSDGRCFWYSFAALKAPQEWFRRRRALHGCCEVEAEARGEIASAIATTGRLHRHCASEGFPELAENIKMGHYQISFGDLYTIVRLYSQPIAVILHDVCKAYIH